MTLSKFYKLLTLEIKYKNTKHKKYNNTVIIIQVYRFIFGNFGHNFRFEDLTLGENIECY